MSVYLRPFDLDDFVDVYALEVTIPRIEKEIQLAWAQNATDKLQTQVDANEIREHEERLDVLRERLADLKGSAD